MPEHKWLWDSCSSRILVENDVRKCNCSYFFYGHQGFPQALRRSSMRGFQLSSRMVVLTLSLPFLVTEQQLSCFFEVMSGDILVQKMC